MLDRIVSRSTSSAIINWLSFRTLLARSPSFRSTFETSYLRPSMAMITISRSCNEQSHDSIRMEIRAEKEKEFYTR